MTLSNINIITLMIIFIFLMPVIIGVLNPFSKGRIQHSMLSIVNGVNFIVGFILSGYLIGLIFSDTKNELLQFLENHVPSAITLIKEYHHDIVAYIIAMFLLMSVIFFILKLLAIPFYRYAITPAAGKISSALDSAHPAVRRLFGGIWQLPKSIWMVLVFAMLLNFYTSFINNPAAGDYISASGAYQTIRSHMLQPILSADAVKKMPVLVSDAFRKAAEDFTPANSDNVGTPNYWKLPAIKYFNGMTIDEAVKSNSEIDSMAQKIVGDEQKDREKAFLLYKWVSRNIRYDNAKAAIILESPSHVNSGSIVTFDERTGVCFDYSCLYVSMCRAAGLKVRLISGLGYSGEEWGEHVWNQVYDPAEDRWINVDTTFGNSGYDYFDNTSFSSTHKYDVVQAEW